MYVSFWTWEFPHRTGGGGMGERGSRRAETAGGLWGKQVWALVWGESVWWFAWGRGLTAGGTLVIFGLGERGEVPETVGGGSGAQDVGKRPRGHDRKGYWRWFGGGV